VLERKRNDQTELLDSSFFPHTYINSFLNSIVLPQINKEQTNTLDSPLTQDDLFTELNLMPNNKAPGLDGYPTEFYKHFWSIIAALFHKMIIEIKQCEIPS